MNPWNINYSMFFSFSDDVYEQFDYEILSKFNKKKLAREASLENESLAANNAISTPAPCKSACC